MASTLCRGAHILNSPAQCGGVDRGIPEALHLLIEQGHRYRATSHVERGHEIVDQRASDGIARGLDAVADVIVRQVELGQRCAS